MGSTKVFKESDALFHVLVDTIITSPSIKDGLDLLPKLGPAVHGPV